MSLCTSYVEFAFISFFKAASFINLSLSNERKKSIVLLSIIHTETKLTACSINHIYLQFYYHVAKYAFCTCIENNISTWLQLYNDSKSRRRRIPWRNPIKYNVYLNNVKFVACVYEGKPCNIFSLCSIYSWVANINSLCA